MPREARPDSRGASVSRGVGPDALARFQDAFADALLSDAPAQAAPRDVAALVAQPGFAIYRNTVIKGCVDALAANYPATLRIVGEAWFRAAAALYAREHLPGDPALVRYGERFAAFLAGFAPAAELPYLPDVARLDRFWTEASIARDEPAAGAADVAALPLDDPARILLVPHASARWAWFEAAPIFTLWERNRAAGPYDDSPLDWRGEGALVLRPGDGVRALPLDAAGCALMDACAAGDSVARAADAVLASHPDADFAALLARLLDAGAFGSVRLRSTSVDRAVSIV
ncbi:MAG: DNA-binding domain-containing protein [Betaproteobacteria bacterium]